MKLILAGSGRAGVAAMGIRRRAVPVVPVGRRRSGRAREVGRRRRLRPHSGPRGGGGRGADDLNQEACSEFVDSGVCDSRRGRGPTEK